MGVARLIFNSTPGIVEMEIDWLKDFIALARLRHFSQAANKRFSLKFVKKKICLERFVGSYSRHL